MNEIRIGAEALSAQPLKTPSLDSDKEHGGSFSTVMASVVGEANRDQLSAERAARELAAGKTDIVDTVLALNKAELSLRMVVEIRNRLLSAWQEISHVGR